MFGLLNVNKPVGLTSHDVVARVRRMLTRGVKVGHSGTLDPFASGVLVLGIGPATRLAECITAQAKQYVAKVAFGVTSTTDDTEGQRTETHAPLPSLDDLGRACPHFVGLIDQAPPAFSAVHVDGQRAYHLARNGANLNLPTRKVQVHGIEVLGLDGPMALIRIDCGSGVYIRSIARDLGRRLGCGGLCAELTRTRVGRFTIDDAVALEDLSPETLPQWLIPASKAVVDWPSCTLSAEQAEQIRQGKFVAVEVPAECQRVAAMDDRGALVALCRPDEATGLLRPAKVFPPA